MARHGTSRLFQFDAKRHREFDENTRAAARQEVYHSFAYLLRSSDSGRLGELLKSDFVHINGLLAEYYSIDGVTGDGFRRVKLPENSPRGGLLGMAAIHAMGSDGIVSSPVERGAWVLRHLLHDPPPPAPPNVLNLQARWPDSHNSRETSGTPRTSPMRELSSKDRPDWIRHGKF